MGRGGGQGDLGALAGCMACGLHGLAWSCCASYAVVKMLLLSFALVVGQLPYALAGIARPPLAMPTLGSASVC